MTLAIDYAARTDVGLVRSRNEDSGYAGPHLLAVADGMGGHAGGDIASSLVIARLAPLDGDSHGADDALEILARTLAKANASLASAMQKEPELKGMGTTLSALMRCGSTGLALVHIGDSRAFLLRDGAVTQITRDHSFVQSLVDTGRITEEEAEHHPQRSLVTRVLTGAPEDEPDLSIRQARLGDRYLICSDGLSDYVGRDTIAEVLGSGLPPDGTTAKLVDLALRAGAPDNVTVVIGDIVDATSTPASQPIIVGAVADRRREIAAPATLSPAAKAAALRREALGTPDEELDDDPGTPARPWLRWIAVASLVVLAAGAALYAAYDWTRSQYFIGDNGAYVAVYRGIPQDLGPIHLSTLTEVTTIPLTDLPSFERSAVDSTISVADEAEARSRVESLRQTAQACRLQRSLGTACGSGAS
ncbi:PP2C family protein-serine/threonine phosphatase [Mobilicoccus pelagius]|uniref:Serine/threonine protein phosphatase PstP n=1 Tax=Mobilicoccus pelagius NBRC 104925 TaxID=1089455 RepID=H5USU0_9MICO|nr:PP2C family serine/threonine-protein phosphatase [Mobilicoccus pelagius]GAB48798.1 serine/threonine protein phosphatase PstP [Mobilicoccus pelagius NBRC 104925]